MMEAIRFATEGAPAISLVPLFGEPVIAPDGVGCSSLDHVLTQIIKMLTFGRKSLLNRVKASSSGTKGLTKPDSSSTLVTSLHRVTQHAAEQVW